MWLPVCEHACTFRLFNGIQYLHLAVPFTATAQVITCWLLMSLLASRAPVWISGAEADGVAAVKMICQPSDQ